ncbi:uncharacterized protein [Blastocystis hominis]|uniref:Enoyl reductase (ER) domain-containing protein n=1 Tax=Blastocystis hominis TaxID=12968 RepID=D8LW82_BLAHO|nr:uncharacterized protein [Blastocystis hominis]CBK20071.2 unnamed protein product [Blastocystis hominis]|eukprot:XP_012894119.1 uncharacterized protein [Blastocystis hominis]
MDCIAYDCPLVLTSQKSRSLQKGQVRIRTRFAGINYADLLACQGKYQEKSKPPFSPGLEVSGQIVECNGCSSRQVGDRVYCIFSANGAFAEECVVDESRCFLVPQHIPLNAITSLGINFCTASLGLEVAAKMSEGEVVTVTGAAGGTGLAATELSLSRHHPTVCVVRGQQQKEFLNNLLRDSYPNEDYIIIDSEDTIDFRDCIKSRYGGSDVVFDTVGTESMFNKNLLRSVRFGAHIRLVVVGFSGGSIQQIPANHLLVKNCSALGIYLGGYLKNRPEVVQKCIDSLCELYTTKQLHPHLFKVYPLESANEALNMMKGKKIFGKILLEMNHE